MSFEEIYEVLKTIKSNLEEIKNQPTRIQRESDRWLNLKEFCEYHPDKPAGQTVYGWTSNRTVPHYTKGKKVYFLKSEIDEWLKAGRKRTKMEMEYDADNYQIQKKRRLGKV